MNSKQEQTRTSSKPLEAEQKPKKKVKNVFTYMESTYQSKGPKSLLYKSIRENRRIKVWTRSHSYVRSIITGYLLAFDQYWNLAMIDVDEVYRVPNGEPCQAVNALTQDLIKLSVETANKQENNESDDIDLAKLNLYKSGKFNLFERHANQLFIRGDNIVTVVLAD